MVATWPLKVEKLADENEYLMSMAASTLVNSYFLSECAMCHKSLRLLKKLMWHQIKLEFNMQTVEPAMVLQIALGQNSMTEESQLLT